MILIYTEEKTSRLDYILKLIFEDILRVKFIVTTNPSDFRKSDLPKINYSSTKFENELYLKPDQILFSSTITYPDFNEVLYNGDKYFFETSDDSFLPFDPLAASFFLVSRLEEYLEEEKGKYNCYPAHKSILSKYGLSKKPVVNIWANIISEKIKEKYPEIEFPPKRFKFIPTIDIDNAWAYAHKGFLRSVGAFLKDLFNGKLLSCIKRVNVWFFPENDPYNTYSYIDNVYKGKEKNAIFFFLMGDHKKYDKNISHKNKSFQKLIQKINGKYNVGIHPSFESGKTGEEKRLNIEINRMKDITGINPDKSRQHFLRVFFPKTYQELIKNGISEDYSMGYSAQTGFRAGICTPFNFFDLETNLETDLKIYPFQVMDVTLLDYLNLSIEDAKKEIEQLLNEIKMVGGTFTGIWHNETLTDSGQWKGYREVFEYMNKRGFELTDE